MDRVSWFLPRPGMASSHVAAWSYITTSHDQLPVTPSYREAGSQCVLIITQNLREAELVYFRTTVPSIGQTMAGKGGGAI